MDRRRRSRLLATALAGALILAALAWALRPTVVEVEAARGAPGEIVVTLDEQGETRAHDRYAVTAPFAGLIERIELHDGDAVAAGATLVTIAPLPLGPRERDEQAARVAAAAAREREARELLARARDDLALAQRERERITQLAGRGLLPAQQADAAANAATAAAAEVGAARQRATAASAELRLARAALDLRPARVLPIPSPVDGRILRVADPSARVVTAGEVLLTVGRLDRLEVVAEFLSQEAVRLRPGMPARLEDWGGEPPLRARVRHVEPLAFRKVSALGVEEQRTRVLFDFVEAPVALGDGYRVMVRVEIARAAAAVTVPASALFRCSSAWCVFAIEGGRARRREIRPGLRNADLAAVESGLAVGQQVVRFPDLALQDGSRVSIRGGGTGPGG